MCYALFALAIALVLFYSHTVIEPYALSLQVGGDWVTVALGWEMLQALWPLLLLGFVCGSAVTYLATRLLARRGNCPTC